jgi:uncharacterized protein
MTDTAGPLLGWSLGSGFKIPTLDELVEFPCTFCFKAVGKSGEGFVSSMLERVAGVIGRVVGAHEHSVRTSARGNYESVTINLHVTSGDEVRAVYRAIREDARVKYLL